MKNGYIVRAFWDEEAHVWCAEGMNFFGLATESQTLDGLMNKIPDMIADLNEANEEIGVHDLPLQLLVESAFAGRSLHA